jgi:phosphoribosylamine--glycine ligase/phosphoribosylformylglycinamidine cyclo-ligase
MADQQMHVLVLGSGGREHAPAWSLSRSPIVRLVTCIPGNGGTAIGNPKVINVEHSISRGDFPWLVSYAKRERIDLVVPGSEASLVEGIAEAFKDTGLPVFGPSIQAARLEGSKCFAKDFMIRHSIPTATYRNFGDFAAAKDYLKEITQPVVIKASGLAGGKGVLMPRMPDESVAALRSLMVDRTFDEAGGQVVVEEWLDGPEISITIVTDGFTLEIFPPGQDAQRILDGNMGANTGGMGVYVPTPLLSAQQLEEIRATILQPTIDGCRAEGSRLYTSYSPLSTTD